MGCGQQRSCRRSPYQARSSCASGATPKGSITRFDDGELDSLARRARDLAAAVTEVTGAPAICLLVFGRGDPYFHVVVIARSEDVPPRHRSATSSNSCPTTSTQPNPPAWSPQSETCTSGLRPRSRTGATGLPHHLGPLRSEQPGRVGTCCLTAWSALL